MRVLPPPPSTWGIIFRLIPISSAPLLSPLLVLLCKKLAHSWQPQQSFHFLQKLIYESQKYATPLRREMGSLNSPDLEHWYPKVLRLGSCELVRVMLGD